MMCVIAKDAASSFQVQRSDFTHAYAFFIILFGSCSIWWLCCLVDVCIRCGVGIGTESSDLKKTKSG
jgi:hypothetical protein